MSMIGKLIAGRYEIIEEIGKGGMAKVYKSKDKLLNRYVAVKILKDDYKDDKEFVRRFNTEAQAAASLSNPHIVSIYDVGCEDGINYIVMEYIEGETLKTYIDRVGAIPWRKAAEYALQICEGIEEAHNNSVIHRDIKPQNIIMAPDGILKITDFGIARAATQTTTTMASNNTIGTAHYLSPEQARGGYTDERTDIYSMGIVMYEMLTGELPFDDSTAVAIAIKHLQENATPITELNPDVPKALEAVVMKAMTKEQNSRYSSITDMISDINKVLVDPNIGSYGGRKPRNGSSAAGSGTVKMPSVESGRDLDSKIPGIDMDEYDKQDKEYEELERLNEKRAKRMEKKKKRKVAFVAFISALAVLAAGIALAFALTDGFGIFMTPSNTMSIPNLVGMTLKDAQAKYGETFSILEQSRTESTQPVGTIIEQSPGGDSNVAKRDNIIIRVITSSGSTSITLNNYSGVTFDEAKADLEKLGLACNKIEKVNSEVKEGLVFEQVPAAGSALAAGDTVTLTVSIGNEPQTEAAPENKDKTDKSETEAETKKNNTVTENKTENTTGGQNANVGGGANTNSKTNENAEAGSGSNNSQGSGGGAAAGGDGDSGGGDAGSAGGEESVSNDDSGLID